jgi:hypothetical protein
MRTWARLSAIAALVMMAAVTGVAAASPAGGGGHSGGGGGGGHFAGGMRGGGFHGGYGGYGWRGGYGWHGGYGWRGGYYGGWCCGWGWGWGLGVYLPLLPWYYSTYWWDGQPYYYADGNYYLWNGNVGEYEAVEPPSGLSSAPPRNSVPPQGPSVNPAVSSELFAYPKGGQSEAQQIKDKEECRSWATSQSGFSPTAPASGKEPGDTRQSYLRAEAACLEGRNYSVR